MANKPHKLIRWTIMAAAAEFDIDRLTLSKRLRALGEEPGEDGCYATVQILKAVFGDLEREKIRNEAAAADLREMKRDLERGRLIPKEKLRGALEELRAAIVQVIEHSELSVKQKEAIYQNLRKLGEVDFVARSESDATE